MRRRKLAPGEVVEHSRLGKCTVLSVRKCGEHSCEALLEVQGNGLFRKTVFWASELELAEAAT